MIGRSWKFNLLLLLTAAIWGFAFVAQRVGMAHVGPFTFNGVRFALGAMILIPLLVRQRKRPGKVKGRPGSTDRKFILLGGGLAGLFLFFGASLQQTGIVSTTAGKAGFITGLYVIIVPILGLFWRLRSGIETWLGAVLAVTGLYLLSMTGRLSISMGDLLVLLGAFFWAGHVLIIGWLSPKIDPIKIAFLQFAACSLLSLITAGFVETVTLEGISGAAIPILYAGLMSSGVAYTLQVVAQRRVRPTHAAIILSLEAIFAVLGGWLLLEEILTVRELLGCALMLGGMLLSQMDLKAKFLPLRSDAELSIESRKPHEETWERRE
ncbi:DMT family transporter [Candidatus Zixiibacteriota bacterium]